MQAPPLSVQALLPTPQHEKGASGAAKWRLAQGEKESFDAEGLVSVAEGATVLAVDDGEGAHQVKQN